MCRCLMCFSFFSVKRESSPTIKFDEDLVPALQVAEESRQEVKQAKQAAEQDPNTVRKTVDLPDRSVMTHEKEADAMVVEEEVMVEETMVDIGDNGIFVEAEVASTAFV